MLSFALAAGIPEGLPCECSFVAKPRRQALNLNVNNMKSSHLLHSVVLTGQVFALCFLLFSACADHLMPISSPRGTPLARQYEGGSSFEGGDSTQTERLKSSDVFVCGIEGTSLVLFKNGKRSREFAMEGELALSTDSDLHFLREEDIYSVSSSTNSTSVWRNAELLFTFPSREYITDLLVRDGSVWTLSKRLVGEGFSFRKDGEELFGRDSGCYTSLYEESSHLYFSYRDSVSLRSSLYLVEDGTAKEITPDPFAGSVVAALVKDGTLWRIINGNGSASIFEGEQSHSRVITGMPSVVCKWVELYPCGNSCAGVIANYYTFLASLRDMVFMDSESYILGDNNVVYHYFGDGPAMHIVHGSSSEVYVEDKLEATLEGVPVPHPRLAAKCKEEIYICCNPAGETPYIWRRDGATMPLPIRGSLIGIWVDDS